MACGGSKEETKPTPAPDAAAKGVTVQPEAYTATKYALISFHGNKNVPTKGLSEKGAADTKENAWGEEAAAKLYTSAKASLDRATGVITAEPATFAAVEPYTAAAEAPDAALVAAPGLKKLLPTDPAALGKIATAADVDAVVIVKNVWSVNQTETKDAAGAVTKQQVGTAEVALVMVNREGKTVAEFADTCTAPLATADAEFAGRGEIKPEQGNEFLVEATNVCLKKFEESFRAKWPAGTPARDVAEALKAKEEAAAAEKKKADDEAAAAAASAAKVAEEEAAKKKAEEEAAAKGAKGGKKKKK